MKLTKYIVVLVSVLLLFESHHTLAQNEIGFKINNPDGYVEIPFTLSNNLIIVSVVLNNVLPLKFIIDTGVRNTVLLEKMYSDILNVELNRKLSLVGAAGGPPVEAYVANNVRVDLLGISSKNSSILVLAEDYLELGKMIGQDVHGILGYDLFRNFIVTINYDTKIITFQNPEKFKKPLFGKSFPLKIEDTKPYLYATIDTKKHKNIPTKLMIDTGASHAIMLHPGSDARITLPDKRIRDLIGVGLGGDIHGYVGRINKVSLPAKKYELTNVVASFPDLGSYADLIDNTERNGTIGGTFLNRFIVTFNYPGEELILKKNWLKRPFHYDMSGLTIKADGAFYENLIIKSIRENSVAEKAGLQVGDQIIRANSLFGTSLNLSNLNFLLRKRKNKKITLVVMRNDEKMKFSFRLQDII